MSNQQYGSTISYTITFPLVFPNACGYFGGEGNWTTAEKYLVKTRERGYMPIEVQNSVSNAHGFVWLAVGI